MPKDINETVITTTFAGNLAVSSDNPRSNEAVDPDDLAVLAENILAHGVLVPIIGYWDGDIFKAVAGGRRTRALQSLINEGAIDNGYEVPIRDVGKIRALTIGIAEQVTHRKLTPLDELRIYTHPEYHSHSAEALAKLLGKSVKAVEQRRKVLELPEDVLALVFAEEINVDQAHGLTYFLEDPELLEHMVQRCQDYPSTSLADLRRVYTRLHRPWDQMFGSDLITQDAYIEAGGKLQRDLFTDEAIVLNPDIFDALLDKVLLDLAKEENPGYGYYRPYDHFRSKHPGINTLTDEESDELEALYRNRWSDSFEDEDRERLKELEDKEAVFTDELKAFLVCQYQPSRIDSGVSVVRNILPDDLEPLYDAGLLERPDEHAEEASEEPEKPQFTQKLLDVIRDIKLHTFCMEAIKKPDLVLADFTSYMNHNTYRFQTFARTDRELIDTYRLEFSAQWLRAQESATSDQKVFLGAKPAEQRKGMAYSCLLRLQRHVDTSSTASCVRRYFTPDEDFFKLYSKPVLVSMIAATEIMSDAMAEPKPKKALAEAMAKYAADHSNYLPEGFEVSDV